MSKTQVACPSCNALVSCPQTKLGRQVRCPKCGETVVMRSAAAPVLKVQLDENDLDDQLLATGQGFMTDDGYFPGDEDDVPEPPIREANDAPDRHGDQLQAIRQAFRERSRADEPLPWFYGALRFSAYFVLVVGSALVWLLIAWALVVGLIGSLAVTGWIGIAAGELIVRCLLAQVVILLLSSVMLVVHDIGRSLRR